ncbi:hypothetical protein [Phytohabitans kaempferiae]|uniref:CBM6 domain-containing protein n=1 Tax=Phytohabitans kaempferiae TaxID=1620943 RepID=A0ABV6LXM8_9ACTN
MPLANVEQPGRGRPGPWRLAASAALASLGVVVLVGAVRYGAAATSERTPVAEGGPAPTTPYVRPVSPEGTVTPVATPTGAPGTAAGSPPVAVSPSAAARPKPSSRPAGPGRAPVPAASPSSRTPAPFTPVSVQAEHPANVLDGGAAVTACASCDGGGRVRFLGRVVVYLDVPVAGTRTVTVTYESDGSREMKVAINNGSPRTFPVSGTSWELPRTFRFTAAIPAGRVAITLYNDTSPAPDVDKVTIG